MKTINEYFSQNENLSLISEYLLSKNKNKTSDDFIQFKTKEEVCDFLEKKEYEKNELDYNYYKMIYDFEKSN